MVTSHRPPAQLIKEGKSFFSPPTPQIRRQENFGLETSRLSAATGGSDPQSVQTRRLQKLSAPPDKTSASTVSALDQGDILYSSHHPGAQRGTRNQSRAPQRPPGRDSNPLQEVNQALRGPVRPWSCTSMAASAPLAGDAFIGSRTQNQPGECSRVFGIPGLLGWGVGVSVCGRPAEIGRAHV